MAYPEELQLLAREIAREAGELAKRRRAEGVAVAASKSSLADIVTEADREVEALIRLRVAEARPEDGFLGEESDATGGSSGLTWVVDPIDGTVNYAFGVPIYSVSIAVTDGTDPRSWRVKAGAVFAPGLGELFSAAEGEGAWLGDERLAVTTDVSAGALIGTGFGYNPDTHASDLATVGRVMPLARDLRRMGSAAIDLAYVAAGRLDAFYERGLNPWDMAAGSLLVTEAGGMTGWREPDRWGRGMFLAAGPVVFDRLDAAIASDGAAA